MQNELITTFYELVNISSESKNEGAFHAHLENQFANLGLSLKEDESMALSGLGGNNMIFTLEGDDTLEPIFISCHTDTVSPGVGIKPELRDGVIYSKSETILGADDKAGITVMIELIKKLKQQNLKHPTIEFVLTPGEEIGLVGAKHLDMSMVKSTNGIVLDSAGPVGAITLSSPSLATLTFDVTGKAAHAGIEPEKGISAISTIAEMINLLPLGRISSSSTANIGTITGGTATNVVAEHAQFTAEVRAIDYGDFTHLLSQFHNITGAIAKERNVTLNIDQKIHCLGYRFDEEHPFIQSIASEIEAIGRVPRYEHSGGGSDANIFNADGKVAVNLSIGYEAIHTTDEYIPVEELEKTLELCLAIVLGVQRNVS